VFVTKSLTWRRC